MTTGMSAPPGRATPRAAPRSRTKRLAAAAIRTARSRHAFIDAMVFGCIAALLLNLIPWAGGFLAALTLALSAAVGLIRELQEALTRLFDTATPFEDPPPAPKHKRRTT